jgi:hypothetical protein
LRSHRGGQEGPSRRPRRRRVKKRLDKNRRRSIIVAKGRRYWVYAYLFAKKDRANIEDDELKAFRKLADLYAGKTDVEIEKELKAEELVEICNDRDA